MLQVAQSAFIPPIFFLSLACAEVAVRHRLIFTPTSRPGNYMKLKSHTIPLSRIHPAKHLMCPAYSLGMSWGLILPMLAASNPQGCSGCEAQLQHSTNNNISEITSKQSQTRSSCQQAGRTYRCRRHPETHTSNRERAYNADWVFLAYLSS